MAVQTTLETSFLSISLPWASLSPVLVFSCRVWGGPDIDSAVALEAKHGGVRGWLSTIPRVRAG